LDIMFNNAGLVGAVGPIEKVGVEDWDRTIEVLLRSVFLGIKHMVELMRKAGGGSIGWRERARSRRSGATGLPG
jgi:NAD(P)-dependent dehydrogenase (short-subunit alcohol dehydrogenase family)